MDYKFPISRQQKQFEDLAKNIVKMLAELTEEQQNDLHEYALQLWTERFNSTHTRWADRNK